MQPNQPFNWGFSQPQEPEMKVTIIEEPAIAQGHYSHVFVTGYDPLSEHYNLDFFQDSRPQPETNQINRYLVARIFLTKAGLAHLAGVLQDLNNQVNQLNRPRLPEGDQQSKQ